MTSTLHLKELLCPEILFINGLARTGKTLASPLFSNLARVDYYQVQPAVDQIPGLWKLGLMDDATAAAFLRMTVDVHIYNRIVGRDLNSRFTDSTWVYNALDAPEIIQRSLNGDGQTAVDEFNAMNRIPSISTHYSLSCARLFLTAVPGTRIVHMVRHPLDICDSWRRRGWGHRFGTDPTAFTLTVKTDDDPVPWFAAEISEKYARMSHTDRIVWSVLELTKENEQSLAGLSHEERSQVHIVTFEDLATDTMAQLQSAADWLDTEVPPTMALTMAREGVPRDLSPGDRDEKLRLFREDASPELFERLRDAGRSYETHWEIEKVS